MAAATRLVYMGRIVALAFRWSLALAGGLCAADARCAGLGEIVGSGAADPLRTPIEVSAASTVRLDLIIPEASPEDAQYRWVLFASGGSLAAAIAAKDVPLHFTREPAGGYRAPLEVSIPDARLGARLFLRIERLAPSKAVVGEVALQIRPNDPGLEIRTLLDGRTVRVIGESREIKRALAALQVPFDESPQAAPRDILFTEDPDTLPPGIQREPCIVATISLGKADALLATAERPAAAWVARIQLPRSRGLETGNAAFPDLVEAFRFLTQLDSQN
jgi:hypothetical protein